MDKVYYWALIDFGELDTGDNGEIMVAPRTGFHAGITTARSRSEVYADIMANFFEPRHIKIHRVPELRPVFDEKHDEVLGYVRRDDTAMPPPDPEAWLAERRRGCEKHG